MTDVNTAEILILSAVKTVGKRDFLKNVERLFKMQVKEKRQKIAVDDSQQCVARVKGDRTGIKVGRYVLFDSVRCNRCQVDDGMCAIHKNQVTKFGALNYGKFTDPLTDELKNVFGDI